MESKFTNGQFLQTLTCVRMNNQQGQGVAPNISQSVFDNQYLSEKKKTVAQTDGTLAGIGNQPDISGEASIENFD